jgi:hypothetical protein
LAGTGPALAQDNPPEKGTTGEMTVRPAEMVLENPVEISQAAPVEETVPLSPGWQNIMTDGFEGTFPGVWGAFANSGPDAYWGKDNYRSHSGSYSAFCAKNGSAGVNPPNYYLDNMDAWMAYGPFSLADTTDAELNYYLWLDSELDYDGIAIMASTDGAYFYGEAWTGLTDWTSMSFDLTDVNTLGNLCGESRVWIAFIFISNGSNHNYAGAFVDDVVLRKYTTPVEPTWTFMVYLDGDNNLEGAYINNFNYMELAADNANVNVVVQFDRTPNYDTSNGNWTTTRRYKVKHDTNMVNFASYTVGVDYWDLGELNMADPDTLIDFVQWAETSYPADHYCLTLSNHGGGWEPTGGGQLVPTGILWDVTDGDYMSTAGLGDALNSATSGGTEKLDVLFLDACLEQMIEVGYEVKDYSQYLVTTEYVGWAPGPYDAYIASITSTTTASQLATTIVNEYHSALTGTIYAHTMSAVDLTPFGLASVVDDFAQELTTGLSTYQTEIENSRNDCQKFYDDSYIDLYHFAFLIDQNIADATIQSAAQAVMTAVDDAVIAEAHESGSGGEYYQLGNAHGISIYFPASEDDYYYSDYNSDNLTFVADEGWDEFLDAFFTGVNTPPEVTNVTASQGSPTVNISYDVADAEQSQVSISFEYWDGSSWQACTTTTGEGTQTTGTGKSGTWNAKTDFDEHYMTDCKIRVTADDGQAENHTGSGESSTFTLDTKDPTGYGCSTPTSEATGVSINPDLTCLTASDDSPPVSYYFQLAENDTFSLGLQESDWQTNTTWSPSTLGYSTQYFWRVKAKDSYANETDYSSTFNFTTEAVPNNPPDAPASPLCEGVTNPTGVTDPTPEFSWTFSDPDGGDTQGAYRILVASSSGNLTANNGDMWNSGKVSSSASEVSYAGTALAENQTYYWKMKTWDNNDAEGNYCSEQQFTTATSPSEVWVDGSWAGSTHGASVDSHTFGTDAFDNIQDGIDAVAGSTVHVAAGTYYERITLKDGVEVLGAGAGVTTIDGGGGGSVVTASNVGSGAKLDGFTITHGSAENGGGMDNYNSSPTVTNCTFSDNSATSLGGGMYNDSGSSPTVTNCTFSGNSASWGGGMYNNANSSPTVTNCTFSGNSASGGGGMDNNANSSPTVTNCTFSGNSVYNGGGGMYNNGSSPTVSNCTFSGNSASYDGGGGMQNTYSSPTVTNCIFFGNSVTHYGGGGMYNYYGSKPTVTNCTFSGNSAVCGGGMAYYYEFYNFWPTVTNCILWGNTGGEIYNYNSWSVPVVTYCDVQGGYSGASNIDADPIFVNPSADDYHLQTGSPCIDAGDNAAPSLPSTDFDGDSRIIDGNGDLTDTVDMGADEYLPPNTPPEVSSVTASQGSPTVNISYDVSDAEQSQVNISFEYWDGSSWQACTTTTGDGTQTTGTGKSGTWNAKTDFDEHYMTDCKIRVTADDGQAENNTGSGESSTFTLDTKDPTGYGCSTPTNEATGVSINPDLTCLTASDDSPPVSYYFQLAENDTFSLGLQESGWQESTEWSPATLTAGTVYWWKVKARDSYGNERQYSVAYNFTTELGFDIPLKAGWNMFGLPVDPGITNPGDIFSSVGSYYLYTWDAVDKKYVIPTELTPEKGYWILVFDDVTQTVHGTAIGEYSLSGSAGWHMIGSLSAEAQVDVISGDVYPQFYTWDAVDKKYVLSPSLAPGKGYWLLAFTGFSITVIPEPPPTP